MIWAYIAGLLTIPLGYVAFCWLAWAVGRNRGGKCEVCTVYPDCEPGEMNNLHFWIRSWFHRVLWSNRPSHKAAWRDHPRNPKTWKTNA